MRAIILIYLNIRNTRPNLFKGMKVPDVLLSGNHKEIEAWRKDQMKVRTLQKRKDLIEREEN